MYIIIYRLLGYRTSVVRKNLKNSFPEKSDNEIDLIESGFYRHLCDLIIESIRLFSISEKELRKRFKIINPEILDQLYVKGKSIILVGGHYNNWELAAKGFDLVSPHQAVGIYTPLRDKFFEKKLNSSRTQYGVEIVSRSNTPRSFINNKDRLTMTIFGADQSPTGANRIHWMEFLNQETAVFLGTESFAVKYNYPVVFIRINKSKRGCYEGILEVLSENPSETAPGEITELQTKSLEKVIKEQPQYWLWSHKRWKRNRAEEERVAELKVIQQAS
jgi:KDO2-lipid IV(A) lauroyltransferase